MDLFRIVFRLVKDLFVVREVYLQLLDFLVCHTDVLVHRLDVSAQLVCTPHAALCAMVLQVQLVELGLQLRDFLLVDHQLSAQVFSKRCVLIIASLGLACEPKFALDVRVLVNFVGHHHFGLQAPLDNRQFAHFLPGELVLVLQFIVFTLQVAL